MNLTATDTSVLVGLEEQFLKSRTEIAGLMQEAEELLSDPIVQDETDPVGSLVRTIMTLRLAELKDLLSRLDERLNHISCELIHRA